MLRFNDVCFLPFSLNLDFCPDFSSRKSGKEILTLSGWLAVSSLGGVRSFLSADILCVFLGDFLV
jgi:hypothetical protein